MACKKYQYNGKTFYEVHVKIRNNYGKQVNRRRRGISSEAKAKRIEADLRLELLKIKEDRVTPTWDEWVYECIGRMKLEFRHSTILNYRGSLDNKVTPLLTGISIDKIKKKDIHSLLFEKLSHLTDHSRKTVHKHIKRIFNMAIEEQLIRVNPAVGIKIKVSESQKLCLNHEEIKILLNSAYTTHHDYYEVWTVALMTGLRSGELHALLWSDIDFENNFISVNKSWSSKNGLGPTKNSLCREVPISKTLKSFLQEMKLKATSDHVLPRLKSWNKGDQAKVLKEFCLYHGITAIRFHDLRATFITQLLLKDVALAKVMKIVGHARIQTTQKYLRLIAKDIQGTTEALAIELPSFDRSDNNVVSLF